MTAQLAPHRARLKAASAPRVDQFAEHLANGATIRNAAAMVGVSETRAHVWLKGIKAGLGWQAC